MATQEQFAQFFYAIHGVRPPRWIQQLTEQVLIEGTWPETVFYPSSSDRLGVLDAAVYVLAKTWRQTPRPSAVRIWVATNRSSPFEASVDHAKRLAENLIISNDPCVRKVASELGRLSLGGRPLLAARLTAHSDWADEAMSHPRQPAILVTTIDQFGSRLLFRAQGSSASWWPLQAALAGLDSHLFLDSAQPEAALRETIGYVQRTQARAVASPVGGLLCTCLSAVPARKSENAPTGEPKQATVEAGAGKPCLVTLVEPPNAGWLDTLQDEVQKLVDDGARQIGCLWNNLPTARQAFGRLISHWGAMAEVILVTGRTRCVDAERLKKSWWHQGPARKRKDQLPLIMVGTQALAGTDLAMDALVTQLAPLAELVERFSKLSCECRERSPRGRIFVRRGVDPVYGDLDETAEFLRRQSSLDLAAANAANWSLSQPGAAPIPLLPPLAELFASTNPLPQVNPRWSDYVHGRQPVSLEISLCWRQELDQLPPEQWPEVALCMPPEPAELLSLPTATFQAWRRNQEDCALSDLSTRAAPASLPDAPVRPGLVLRYRPHHQGSEPASETIRIDEVAAGDVLLLPAGYGGCDEYGWNPEVEVAVDLYDQASKTEATRPGGHATYQVRLPLSLIPRREWRNLARLGAGDQFDSGSVINRLPPNADTLQGIRLFPSHAPIEILLTYNSPVNAQPEAKVAGHELRLFPRLQGLERAAQELAEDYIADESTRQLLRQAGQHQDLGLANSKLQADLRGSSKRPLASPQLMAPPQSGYHSTADRTARDFHHELLSVKLHLLISGAQLAHDPVAYLIGTHHGYGRPGFPGISEPAVPVRLDQVETNTDVRDLARADSGWYDLIALMHGRYGIWGTAYLEAILHAARERQAHLELKRLKPESPVQPRFSMVPARQQPGRTELPLAGFCAYHPAQFLAALGLLLRCTRLAGLSDTRLSWKRRPGYTACLHVADAITLEELAGRIEAQQEHWCNKPINWLANTPGITAKEFPAALLPDLVQHLDLDAQCYLAAYLRPGTDGYVKHPLIQVCGMLHFETAVDKNEKLLPREELIAILHGAGTVHPDCYSFGLCPDAWVPNYLSADGVTVKNGIPWLMQLALDGFYFLPGCFSGTTLFRKGRVLWPVWKPPLSPAAILRLLQRPRYSALDDLHCQYEAVQEPLTKGLRFVHWPREITGSLSARTTIVD
jgi:CRISPR-associated endonuclease/helicase Cas3